MRVIKDKVPRGEHRFAAKLTEDKVREMRRLKCAGEKYSEIAEKFDVSLSTAKSAIDGHTWRHVTDNSVKPTRVKKRPGRGPWVFREPTPEIIAAGKEMLELYMKGTTMPQLRERYGIPEESWVYRYMNTYRAHRDGMVKGACQ